MATYWSRRTDCAAPWPAPPTWRRCDKRSIGCSALHGMKSWSPTGRRATAHPSAGCRLSEPRTTASRRSTPPTTTSPAPTHSSASPTLPRTLPVNARVDSRTRSTRPTSPVAAPAGNSTEGVTQWNLVTAAKPADDGPMTEQTASSELSLALAQQFPNIPLQSVVRCVWDAQTAVEYAAVSSDDRGELVERLARAHLEELLPFYNDEEEVGSVGSVDSVD